MGSDRARVAYDPQQLYRGVVAQQGRVTLEADWNEQLQTTAEEQRAELQDIVGSSGTPDDGYAISAAPGPSPSPAYDIVISKGTMYVGGVRAHLATDAKCSAQADPSVQTPDALVDWLDGPRDPGNAPNTGDTLSPPDPYWVDPNVTPASNELIALMLREQEVSAVEDSALREVALGGPDTTQRLRLIQRIVRFATKAADCAAALASAETKWQADGLYLDGEAGDKSMRLRSWARLQASYQPLANPPDNCQPDGQGGYLEADNQLIRVQVTDHNSILWGFDNASFLYRVDVKDPQTLYLKSRPVDAFHQPRSQQVVEVLRSAARLNNGEYVASTRGIVARLASAYDPDKQQIALPAALPVAYQNPETVPQVYLRVWEDEIGFAPGAPVQLGNTGLTVTLTLATQPAPGGAAFHPGDYWLIAVRPSTPQQVYPQRLLEAPQPPDGPRMWACPLAVIEWTNNQATVVPDGDCRHHFCTLVEACQTHEDGCCTFSVRPEDADGLQSIVAQALKFKVARICLAPGAYSLAQPLRIGPSKTHLTIDGCDTGAVLQAATGKLANFRDGLIVLNHANNVTLQGLRIEMPQAPYRAGSESAPLLRALQTGATVSIGVRPLHSACLTIQDCLFRFTLTPGQVAFGVSIFAGSECWGLTLKGNRFVREEDYLRKTPHPVRILVGYLLAPTLTRKSSPAPAAATAPLPAMARSLLHNAVLRDNQFVGLTIPALILADCGAISVDNNTVSECLAGFIQISLEALNASVSVGKVDVGPEVAAAGQQALDALAQFLSTLISLAIAAAVAYPLPAEFVAQFGRKYIVAAPRLPPKDMASAARRRFETFFEKILLPPTEMAAAQATAPAQSPVTLTPVVIPPDALGSATLLRSIRTVLARLASVESSILTRRRAKVRWTGSISALAQARSQRGGLALTLEVTNNIVHAFVKGADFTSANSAALMVCNVQSGFDSITCTGNQFIGSQLIGGSTYTAVIMGPKGAVVTGSYFGNPAGIRIAGGNRSLLCYPWQIGGNGSMAAVTGNVFVGTPVLPRRQPFNPPVPPPMDTWEFLNTIL